MAGIRYSYLSCAAALAIFILLVTSFRSEWGALSNDYFYFPSQSKDIEYVPAPFLVTDSFPHPEPYDRHSWNYRTLMDLQSCLALQNCGPNQEKIAILADHWFEEAKYMGFKGGEGIWAISVFNSLKALGYSLFLANNWDEAMKLYKNCPDLVKIVVRNHPGDCLTDNSCIKSPHNPKGIPAWKIFDFDYFPNVYGKDPEEFLDGRWILSGMLNTDRDDANQYIGFSQEMTCTKHRVIPLSRRKNIIWIFMKQLTYIYIPSFTWSVPDFHNLARELSMTFTGGWTVDPNYQRDRTNLGPDDKMEDIADPDKGIVNLGTLDQFRFLDELRKAKVMLAVGNPTWSPSPFEALCLGVPVVHPYWKLENGEIEYQNKLLTKYGPPYVYHVEAHNYQQLRDAIRTASQTPINRFIPEYMTEAALRNRLTNLMENNWRTAAEILLQRRENLTHAFKFEL